MSGYSISHVMVPLNPAKAKAAITHNCRDVLERDGRERHHGNELVDSSRTASNKTFVNDGNGHLVPMASAKQAHDYLNKRITECPPLRRGRDRKTGHVTMTRTTPRVTDNIGAEYVLALDPAWLRGMTREDFQRAKLDGQLDAIKPLPERLAQAGGLLNVMLDRVIKRHGIENVVTYSLHLDESNPHIQMIVAAAARDEDGVEQLSYKMAFASGKDDSRTATQELWSRWHDEMRDDLNAAGYEATYERVDGGRKAQRLPVYKRDQDKRRDEHQAIARQRDENDLARAANETVSAQLDAAIGEFDEHRSEFAQTTKKQLREIARDQQTTAELRTAAQRELEARNEDRRQARAERLEGRRYVEQARAKLSAVEQALSAFESVERLIAAAEKAWSPQSKAAEQARQVRRTLAGPHASARAALDLPMPESPHGDDRER